MKSDNFMDTDNFEMTDSESNTRLFIYASVLTHFKKLKVGWPLASGTCLVPLLVSLTIDSFTILKFQQQFRPHVVCGDCIKHVFGLLGGTVTRSPAPPIPLQRDPISKTNLQ